VALGALREFLEFRLVQAGHRDVERQRDAVDREAVALLREPHLRRSSRSSG
jgi:hypothetical protein